MQAGLGVLDHDHDPGLAEPLDVVDVPYVQQLPPLPCRYLTVGDGGDVGHDGEILLELHQSTTWWGRSRSWIARRGTAYSSTPATYPARRHQRAPSARRSYSSPRHSSA